MKTIISLTAAERLLKKSGASRISEEAKSEMVYILEDIGREIGEHAIKYCKHAGRMTLKKSDLRLAGGRML